MRVTAKYKDYTFDKNGDIELTFTVDSRFIEEVVKLETEHDDKILELKAKHHVGQKSDKQNRAVWKLITMMCEKQDGRATKENKNELYVQLIKIAGIKIDYLQGLPEMQKILRQTFAAVEIRERRTASNGAETCMFELYRGLSQFNKEETNIFIETILDYSEQLGIGVNLESEELRSMLK